MATTTAPLFLSLPSTPLFFLQRNPNPNKLTTISSSRRFPHLIFSINSTARSALVADDPAVVVSADADTSDLLDISQLGISDQIVSALSRRGITELFPIQRAVLEPAMEGRDMIGRAVTGSGKTLAFGIPILDKIIQDQNKNGRKGVPSALVLAPTRELARQVQREFKVSAPRLNSTCVYGGIPIGSQIQALMYGMDIVVGTPGRIIDLVERGSLNLSEIKFVVLDEADQMLAVGFQEDVENILSYLPAKKQCMLFSATMPSWVRNISRKFLRDPLVVDLINESDQKLADGISFYSVSSVASNKQNLLPTLISTYGKGGKCIIFTKTKVDAETLSRSMGRIIGSKALHGNMQQLQRDRTLAAFREGGFNVLIATDVAARGLDIPNVDLVIHYEMPNSTEFFVHRSGRTGRAGKKGLVILMFSERQRRDVRSIEQDLGFKFEEIRGISASTDSRMEMGGSSFEADDDLSPPKPRYPRNIFDSPYGGRSQGSYSSRNSEGRNFSSGSYGRGSSTSRYSEGRSFSSGSNGRGSNSSRFSEGRSFSSGSNGRGSSSPRFSEGRSFSSGSNDRSRGSSPSRFSEGRSTFSSGSNDRSRGSSTSRYSEGRNFSSGGNRRYSEGGNFSSGSNSRPRQDRYGQAQSRRSGFMYNDDYQNDQSSPRSNGYADRKNGQSKMKPRNSSRSSDYDFDDLLDLFKDQD